MMSHVKDLFVLSLVCLALTLSPSVLAQTDAATFESWGIQVLGEIDATLGHPTSPLWAETAHADGTQSGGFNGHAFVWPLSTQLRALAQAASLDSATWEGRLWVSNNEMQKAYWFNARGGHSATHGNNAGLKFYDDNAHIAVGYVDAYRITGVQTYLDRAKATYDFVLEGEWTSSGRGGIRFNQQTTDSADSISTLQGMRAAAMLAQHTTGAERDAYLADVERLWDWAAANIQLDSGRFSQGFDYNNNQPAGVDIVNASSIGVSAHLEWYKATGDQTHLDEALAIANATVGRFINTDTNVISDEGLWAFELVEAYNALSLETGDTQWTERIVAGLTWLHDNKQDSNGHYGLFWGRDGPITGDLTRWHLNDMAPVAFAYLDTAQTLYALEAVPEPASLLLLAAPASLFALRRSRRS